MKFYDLEPGIFSDLGEEAVGRKFNSLQNVVP